MTWMLETGAGYWDPAAWLAAFLILAAMAYLIRSFGNKRYRRGTAQDTPFFSGNEAPRDNIKADNVCWGFLEAAKKYYRWLDTMHTGVVNDYVCWFVLVMVLMMAGVMLWGAA